MVKRLKVALILAGLLSQPIMAADALSEYAVKAAFLHTFTKFVEWPQAASKGTSAFSFCVAGPDPFGRLLDDALKDKLVGGRETAVRRWSSLKELQNCDVLFISGQETMAQDPTLSGIKGRPILTISDTPGFLDRGGMISLVMEGAKVRFDINVTSARGAGLTVSSKLLSVARSTR